jgi:hypothetical protein
MQQATQTVPIVFTQVADPVSAGFVDSLSKPGGNLTGFTNIEYNVGAKWLELLKEIVPSITHVGIIRDPSVTASIGQFAAIQSAAQTFGVEVIPLGGRNAKDIEHSVTEFARGSNLGLITVATPRSSIGRRRRSWPSSSSKSNAQSTALADAPWRRIRSKMATPFSSQTIASPSIRHDRTGSLPTAVAIKGKRDEKSFPARVISRTPALSRRARMRKPSCLISCSHPGPEGGTLAGEGKQGSIIPNPGRVRSRNDMGAY